ncbi:hypothetical protein [Acinetobacter sp. CFCC 10889]|uniref:hypothetical protein n=1 Tax=Acinetobacter sp. CFCC 10889 TaxID=1775557 RepID=UPI000DD0D45A|nr:hypothetical protein [Acinetobacter sp. CFCC 10889]
MSTVGKEDETIIDAGGDDQQQLGNGGNANDETGESLDLSTATKSNEDPLSPVDEKPVSPELDQSTKSDDVAAAEQESQPKPKRAAKSTAKQVPKPEADQPLATTQAINPVGGVTAGDSDPKQEESQPKQGDLTPEKPIESEQNNDSKQADSDPKQEEPKAEVVLDPLDLEITNHGSETSCMVTRKIIPRGETVILRYGSMHDKHLAMGNFAQINALAGYKRFIFEG